MMDMNWYAQGAEPTVITLILGHLLGHALYPFREWMLVPAKVIKYIPNLI